MRTPLVGGSLLAVGVTAALSDPSAVDPQFTVDKLGAYQVQLVVNDGTVDSDPETGIISTLNSAPVANAGPDQTARVGETVTLDGSGSSDVDGQALTYLWELQAPPGSSAQLDDPAFVMPRFTVDRPGTYTGSLTVNDGVLASNPDTTVVDIENSPPVANAGLDQTAYVGEIVTLDGSGSRDVDGDPLTFSWSLSGPAGTNPGLDDPSAVNPKFQIELPGTYVGQLIVNDGKVDGVPDTVAISTLNSRPVACIQAPSTVDVGSAVALDGACSKNADGDPLRFQWSIADSPEGSAPDLSGADGSSATLVPDLPGLYVVQLIVSDEALDSAPVTSVVNAELPPNENRSPEIVSTPVTQATVGTPYGYDVEAADPDAGDTLTFSLVTAPDGMTIDPVTGQIAWTPAVSQVGDNSVQMRVTDKGGLSAVQEFTITVTAAPTPNQAPQVDAGDAQIITLPTNSVALNGTVRNGSLISYSVNLSQEIT